MTVKFVLLVNKQGQTRLAKYTDQSLSVEERRALEGEIVRKCLARSEKQVKPNGSPYPDTVNIIHKYAPLQMTVKQCTLHYSKLLTPFLLTCAVLLYRAQEHEGCIQAICITVLPGRH